MTKRLGRPIAPLNLSAEERAYLERQVRRHRVARSFSDRCRMILRCADGLSSKAVGVELGAHEHTVGKWRRRFLKDRIDGLDDEENENALCQEENVSPSPKAVQNSVSDDADSYQLYKV